MPVFADLERNTYNLDPADVERRITPRTKAIIAVHLTGNPVRLDALKALADKHKLILIEDCARPGERGIAASRSARHGHIACFSLQDSKQITCGDGGVVASSDERFGPRLQRFGDKGIDRLESRALRRFRHQLPHERAAGRGGGAPAHAPRSDRGEAGSRLGNLLTEKIAGLPGIEPHQVRRRRPLHLLVLHAASPRPGRCECDRTEFVKALAARGRTRVERATSRCRCTATRCSRSTASSPAAGPSRKWG